MEKAAKFFANIVETSKIIEFERKWNILKIRPYPDSDAHVFPADKFITHIVVREMQTDTITNCRELLKIKCLMHEVKFVNLDERLFELTIGFDSELTSDFCLTLVYRMPNSEKANVYIHPIFNVRLIYSPKTVLHYALKLYKEKYPLLFEDESILKIFNPRNFDHPLHATYSRGKIVLGTDEVLVGGVKSFNDYYFSTFTKHMYDPEPIEDLNMIYPSYLLLPFKNPENCYILDEELQLIEYRIVYGSPYYEVYANILEEV